MCDIDGLLTTTRTDGNLDGHKKYYAKDHKPVKDLEQVVKEIKPSVSHACSEKWTSKQQLIIAK